jgi:class 3 adenylate cyclase
MRDFPMPGFLEISATQPRFAWSQRRRSRSISSSRPMSGVVVACSASNRLSVAPAPSGKPFLRAERLLTNQTFRDLYGAETLNVDQRLKTTSLTYLFTDLKGSTALYDRVGDLAAFDIAQAHFDVLSGIVAAEAGAVVKTIGDAVMATFPTPGRALAAALTMREAIQRLNDKRGSEDLLLKIRIHEGPCLAVMLNERQDYFGQTVTIAARVQGLAVSHAIFTTGPVVENSESAKLLAAGSIVVDRHHHALQGASEQIAV